MKKFSFAVFSFFLTSMLVAQTTSEKKQRFDQGHAGETHLMMPAYNTPARFDVEGAWDTYAFGSYLWWRASEKGLGIGIMSSTGVALFPNSDGQLIDMDFSYHSGFRLGLGTNLGHDNWNLEAKYVVFHTNTKVSQVATEPFQNQGTAIFPLWVTAGNQVMVGAAHGEWKCDTDLFDIEMGRNYYVSTKLTFHPHAGLRLMKIDQRYKAHYRLVNDLSSALSQTVSYSRGIGFRAGIDTGWLLGSGFKIIGNFAFSNIYTKYKVGTSQQRPVAPLFINYDVSGKYYYLRPNVEFVLGVNFGTYAFGDHIHFGFTAAYEQHAFWSQNVMRTFVDAAGANAGSSDDLYFSGLSLTARLDF